jgi:hypothetical protein
MAEYRVPRSSNLLVSRSFATIWFTVLFARPGIRPVSLLRRVGSAE